MRQNATPLGGRGGPLSRGIGASLPDRPSVSFGPVSPATAPRKPLNRQHPTLANTRQNDARPPVLGWRDAGRPPPTPHVAQQVLCYTLQQGVCSMTTFSISAAARAAGVSRTTLQRAIKSGRLSTTTDAAGGRCIDLSELLRAFGPLQATQQGEGAALLQDAAGGRAPPDTLLELLQAQLRDARDREARLLAMLEAEQQARRELEQKLLPAPPRPSSFGNGRLGVLLVLFALVLAIAAAVFLHPDWMR